MNSTPFDGPRPARAAELDAVLATVNLVHRTSRGREPNVAGDFPQVYNADNAENLTIVTDGDRVVASVGLWVNEVEMGAVRLKVGGINCTATLPECRRHGLGRQIMEAARDRMRVRGCHVGLLGTLISNWYRGLGWESAGGSRIYKFDRGNIELLPPLPTGTTLRTAGEDALADVVRLRAADHLGGVRDVASFKPIYRSRSGRQIWLAEHRGTAVAYLIASDRYVAEWGGEAEVVAGLVRAWYERLDDRSLSASTRDAQFRPVLQDHISISAPAFGHGFIGLLDERRVPYEGGCVGMMYLVNPQAILDAFDLKGIACVDGGEIITLTRGTQSRTLSRARATKLFFGPERVTDFAADLFPLPFWQWGMEHV